MVTLHMTPLKLLNHLRNPVVTNKGNTNRVQNALSDFLFHFFFLFINKNKDQ